MELQSLLRTPQITVPVHRTDDREVITSALKNRYGIEPKELQSLRIVKKSIDARRKSQLRFHYQIDFGIEDPEALLKHHAELSLVSPPEVANPLAGIKLGKLARHPPIIVGSGPAGTYAALVMARAGQPCLILERGDAAGDRIRHTNRLRRQGIFDPESHYCYGEGGAGTFSDGKLTCGRNHPLIRYVFQELVDSGAPQDILYEAHPHVGTDYLLKIALNMRTKLIATGSSYRFRERFVGFRDGGSQARFLVKVASGEDIPTDHLILAMGHSARETYKYLLEAGVAIVAKPFAMGVRIEHPQETINQMQYGSCSILPAAEYKLAAKSDNRGIWTFCMCPGGHLLPTMAEPDHLAINGMSYHARNSGFANAAIVVNIRREDYDQGHPLDGVTFQRSLERKAFIAGGGAYHSPAQRLSDFLKGTNSKGDLRSTYKPGVNPARIDKILPDYVVASLRHAMTDFDAKIRGFIHPDAMIVGLESKTSSPVSFPRDENLQSTSHPGLFPCGEGAGYAGGIVSAALDGVRVSRAVLTSIASDASIH